MAKYTPNMLENLQYKVLLSVLTLPLFWKLLKYHPFLYVMASLGWVGARDAIASKMGKILKVFQRWGG